MPSTPQGYQRRNSLRQPNFDYTHAGAYFVTICAHRGRSVFGHVVDQEMMLNRLGQIAATRWDEFATRHPEVEVDLFVVMPNHVHVLLWLRRDAASVGQPGAGKERKFGDAIAGSLSTLIGVYKGAVTQKAKQEKLIPGPPLWQRNFYDRIVCHEQELQHIRHYIENNPARWIEDQFHPDAPPNQFNQTWRTLS
jgi:putative transposase